MAPCTCPPLWHVHGAIRGFEHDGADPLEWRHAHATTGGRWPHTKEPAEPKGGNIAVLQRFTPPPTFALVGAHLAGHLAAIIARRRRLPSLCRVLRVVSGA